MRRESIKRVIRKFVKFLKWSGVSVLVGVTVGLIGTLFSHGITLVSTIRGEHPELILGLPLAGVLIVFLYHIAHRDNDKGTNSVLLAVRSEEQLPVRLGPLIFISTTLTHLFGGSVGRAGASLQIGGSIGNLFARLFRRCPEDEKVIIMCGMSACFATFFIGATFGCMLGGILDISSSLCAAVGMIAVFCGVTNSPITSLLIALELFGMDAMPYFLIAVAVSYCLSGYHSLYATQKIVYSKYKAESKELEA